MKRMLQDSRTLSIHIPLSMLFAIGLFLGLLPGAGLATGADKVAAAPLAQQSCDWNRVANGARGSYHVAGALDTDHNHFYFYGGLNQSGDVTNAVGVLDLSNANLQSAAFGASRSAGLERFGAAGAYRGGAGSAVPEDQKGLYFIGGADDAAEARGEDDVLFFPTQNGKLSLQPATQVGGSLGDRLWAAAAYDADGDALFVVGGIKDCAEAERPCRSSGLQTRYMTWEADGSASWNAGPTSGIPNNSYGLSLVYDSLGKQLLAYGGTRDGSRNEKDVYALDLSQGPDKAKSWTRLSADGTAPALSFHSATFDVDENRMVVTGGTSNGPISARETSSRKTYALNLGGAKPAWETLTNSDGETIGGAAAYAATHQTSVRLGGRNGFRAGGNQNVNGAAEALECVPDEPDTPTPTEPVPGPTTPTPVDPTPITPTPTEPAPPTDQVCPGVVARVPAAVLAVAGTSPDTISGYGQSCNPNLPPGPLNPARTWLGLRNPSIPYHPIFNGLVWKCGCP